MLILENIHPGAYFLIHDNLEKNKKDLSMLIDKSTAAALELLVESRDVCNIR